MSRQSRLRVQREKRGRRFFVYLCLIGLFGFACYQIDQKYQVVHSIIQFWEKAGNPLLRTSPGRGSIYDRNLKQIAVSMERVAVFVRTREVESITDTAIALADALSLNSNKLINQMESGALRLWVAEDISQEQEEAVKKLNLPGVHFQKEIKRYYPNGSHAAHLIGFVEDGIGLSGVEYHYDRLLATRKLQEQKAQKPLSVGQDLVLTIDLKIQNILEEIVAKIGKTGSGIKVAAYLVESESGEFIGGAQYPGFDPNSFTRYNRKAIENLFFEPLFLPDKFRLFLRDSAAFYLQSEVIYTPGKWAVAAPSAKLGNQLRLWEWLKLGENSKVDFFTPKSGSFPIWLNQERVKQGEPSFGLIPEATTPVNLLTAYSVLLNGRFDHFPFVVKEVLDIKTGEKVLLSPEAPSPEADEDFPSEPLPAVKRLFQSQALFRDSSAHYFRDEILVATPVKRGLHQFQVNDLTFITIPAGERELDLLVVVQRNPVMVSKKPEKKLRIVDIVNPKVRRMSILHQVAGSVEDVLEPEIIDEGNYQGIIEKEKEIQNSLQKMQSDEKKLLIMPDLVGMSLRKSLRSLEGLPLKISIEGTGVVAKQIPAAGASLKGVRACRLVLQSREILSPEKMSGTTE